MTYFIKPLFTYYPSVKFSGKFGYNMHRATPEPASAVLRATLKGLKPKYSDWAENELPSFVKISLSYKIPSQWGPNGSLPEEGLPWKLEVKDDTYITVYQCDPTVDKTPEDFLKRVCPLVEDQFSEK